MEIIETIEKSGFIGRIYPDTDPVNPREEYDNVGEILYTSSRYTLGDRQVSPEEIQEKTRDKSVIWLPVYAYIHSGIVLSCSPFSCPWDSGMCGIIWCSKDRAKLEWSGHYIKKAKKYLQGEVETYSQYLAGDVYGFTISNPQGEEIDSCWGFYGFDYITEEVKGLLDHYVKNQDADKEVREAGYL